MNFDGTGGQPFGSMQPNDPSISPLLQPLLNGSAGNLNVSQLEAIRNAAIAAAAAANSSHSAYSNSMISNPFALPLSQSSLPSAANQAQITSDLLYTQSASSMFFSLPAFHQQSRLTLSSSSFANPPAPTPTHNFMPHPTAHQQAALHFLATNGAAATNAPDLIDFGASGKSVSNFAPDLPNKDKKSHKTLSNDRQSAANASVMPPLPADNLLGGAFHPSLWYSSLAAQSLAALTNQIYFNNALKSAANGGNLPMPPMFGANNQQSSLPLHPSFDAILAATAANQSLNASYNAHNPFSNANSKQSHNSMQPIALLSPNNSRYQQPLPELKISACDSTKADADRKKFSPDSSTAIHSPLCSPYANDVNATSGPAVNRLHSPIPIKPNLISPNVCLSQNEQIGADLAMNASLNSNLACGLTPFLSHSIAHSPKASRAIRPQTAKSASNARSRALTKTNHSSSHPVATTPPAHLMRLDQTANRLTATSPIDRLSALSTAPASKPKKRTPITLEDLKPALNQLTVPTISTINTDLPLVPLSTCELPSSPRSPQKRSFGDLHKSSSPSDSSSSSSLSTPSIATEVALNYNTQSPIVSSTKPHTSDRNSSSPEMVGSPSFLSQSSHSLSPCAPRLVSPESPGVQSLNRPSLSPPTHVPQPTLSAPLHSEQLKPASPAAAISSHTVRTRCLPPKKTIQSVSYNPLFWCSPTLDPLPIPPLTETTNVQSNRSPARSQPHELAPDTDEEPQKLIIDEPFGKSEHLEERQALASNLVSPKAEPDVKPTFGNLSCHSDPETVLDNQSVRFTCSGPSQLCDKKEGEQKPIPKFSIRLEQVDKYLPKERKIKRNKRSRNDSQSSNSTAAEQKVPVELLRRHSTDDLLLSKNESGTETPAISGPTRVRCETYSGPEVMNSNRAKRSGKKRESVEHLDPWTIRRSERIFLHSAYQSRTNQSKPPGSLNLILTSHRKSQKDAADAAAAAVSAESSANPLQPDDSMNLLSEQTLQSGSTSGMFSGSVALMGLFENASAEDCKLLQLIDWTREDRLPKSSEFKMQRKLLHQQRQRVLLRSDELLYAGQTHCPSQTEEEPKASVLLRLDGESNDRHMTLKQLLSQAIREYRPIKLNQLIEGTRVCAYWSNRARCLYPGRVTKLLPGDLVLVEFDDGDKGRIALNDIRLLPETYTSEVEGVSDVDTVKVEALTLSSSFKACSERVGESSIRIRLNSSSDRHKRRKHHHAHTHRRHHLKRHKHKKRSKHVDEGSSSSAPNEGGNESESCTGRRRGNKEDDVNDEKDDGVDPEAESSDESSDSESDDEQDNAIERGATATDALSNGDGSNQWVCEVNERRSMRRSSPTCKAVIRRKESKSKKSSAAAQSKRAQTGSSKIAAFLLDRQLWNWHGEPNRSVRGRYRSKKLFYNAIIREDEVIRVNDCAVFLSTGRPSLPFVGRIDSMWQIPSGTMLVRVRWFYHPEETKSQPKLKDCRVSTSNHVCSFRFIANRFLFRSFAAFCRERFLNPITSTTTKFRPFLTNVSSYRITSTSNESDKHD
jgi:hypothetical protein